VRLLLDGHAMYWYIEGRPQLMAGRLGLSRITDRERRNPMQRPRIPILGLMALIAVFAVTLVLVRAAAEASDRVIRHTLTLCYSSVPDRRNLPKDEPVYAEYQTILDSDVIATCLGLLALGGAPMASLLGIGLFLLLRGLVLHGRSPDFLLGFVVSGSATLAVYVACCVLAAGWVERYAQAASDLLLYVPARAAGEAMGDDIALAISNAAVMTVLVMPQVLLSLLGGVLNERKLRVCLQVLPRTSSDH
jgi:hypothetical protein